MRSVIRILLTSVLVASFLTIPALAAPETGITGSVSDAAYSAVVNAQPEPEIVAVQDPSATPQTTAFTIRPLGMTVNIPSELTVLTQNTDLNDSDTASLNLTKEMFENYFVRHDVYLNALDSRLRYEISISMVQSGDGQTGFDFNTLTDSELRSFMTASAALYKLVGMTYKSTELYTRNPALKFFKSELEIRNGAYPACGVQYFTIHNGMAIDITLMSYDNLLDAEREALLAGIVSSISLQESAGQAAGTSEPAPPYAESSAAATSSAVPSSATTAAASVTPAGGSTAADDSSLVPDILSGAAVSFMFVMLPVLIYRYAVCSGPLPNRRAVLVSLLSAAVGVAICVVFILFLGGSELIAPCAAFWVFVNYLLVSVGPVRRDKTGVPVIKITDWPPETALTDERAERLHTASSPVQPSAAPWKDKAKPDVIRESQVQRTAVRQSGRPLSAGVPAPDGKRTCKECLAVNLAESSACFFCGAPLVESGKTTVSVRHKT